MAEAATSTPPSPTGEFVIPPDMKARLVARFDTNKDGTLGTTEVDAAAKRIRQETSVLDNATKEKLKQQGKDLSETEFGQKFSSALGLKIDNDSAVKIAKAYREGLNSEPDKELLAEREKARRAAGNGKDKNPFEMVIDWLKGILVSLGIIKEEKPPETQTADAAGQTPPAANPQAQTPPTQQQTQGQTQGQVTGLDTSILAQVSKERDILRKMEYNTANEIQAQTLASAGTQTATAAAR